MRGGCVTGWKEPKVEVRRRFSLNGSQARKCGFNLWWQEVLGHIHQPPSVTTGALRAPARSLLATPDALKATT